jgi:L-amino acid N-acyltransferase YncA
MAQRLVEMAEENDVARIRALTLPERNASSRILETLGFVLAGSVIHPEDGSMGVAQVERLLLGRRCAPLGGQMSTEED